MMQSPQQHDYAHRRDSAASASSYASSSSASPSSYAPASTSTFYLDLSSQDRLISITEADNTAQRPLNSYMPLAPPRPAGQLYNYDDDDDGQGNDILSSLADKHGQRQALLMTSSVLRPYPSDYNVAPLSRSKRRTRRRRCSWPVLCGLLTLGSTVFVLYLNHALLSSRLGTWVPAFFTSAPSSLSFADTDSKGHYNATELRTIDTALGKSLPPHLHHSPSANQQHGFEHFNLDYYSLPVEHRRAPRAISSLATFIGDSDCADLWVSQGRLCTQASRLLDGSGSLDILYTWVNGSAPHSANRKLYSEAPNGWWEEYWRPDPTTEFNDRVQRRAVPIGHTTAQGAAAKKDASSVRKYNSQLKADNGDNRFRDTSELQYSVRSTVRHVQRLASIHIVSPDFAAIRAPAELKRTPATATKTSSSDVVPSSDSDELAPVEPSPTRYPLATDRFLLPNELLEHESRDAFLAFPGNRSSQQRAGQIPSWLNVDRPDVLVGDKAMQAETAQSNKDVVLRMHHDWSTFTPSWLLRPDALPTYFNQSQVEEWKHAVLPTFNSMAIETYLGVDEAGLSDVFAYANDDFFLTESLTAGDVHTPLYGLVLRLQSHLAVTPHETGFIHPHDHIKGGEWPSYRRSAWLLDQRFGNRPKGRAYLSHVHKSLHRSLLEESRIVFDKPIRDAAGSRFRGLSQSLNTPFLTHSFVIERHREALLWSFFLLRHDVDGDGFYARANPRSSGAGPSKDGEWETLLRELGVGSEYSVRPLESEMVTNGKGFGVVTPSLNRIVVLNDFRTALGALAAGTLSIAVPMPQRASLRLAPLHMQDSGLPMPGMSTYQFSHLDGYPFVSLPYYMQDRSTGSNVVPGDSVKVGGGHYPQPAGSRPTSSIREPWPVYWPISKEQESRFQFSPRKPACRLDLGAQCLKPEWVALSGRSDAEFLRGPRADEVFKRFAFEKIECGDCLLQLLLHKSGETGFSAFMPAEGLLFPEEASSDVPVPQRPRAAQEPHLPLVPHYEDAISVLAREAAARDSSSPKTFTLQTVATLTGWTGLPRSRFAHRLLSRYAFTLADSPIDFIQVSVGLMHNTHTLWDTVGHRGFMCVNDDVVVGKWGKANHDDEAVQEKVKKFFQTMWPTPSQFERV